MSQAPGQLEWVRATNGGIPSTGIAQGVERDGRPLFIARAFYKNGLHPGKAAPHLSNGGFEFAWGGGSHSLNEYFVLCGNVSRTRWVAVDGPVPKDTSLRLVDGGQEDYGDRLFIAKVAHDGSLQLGKAGAHLRDGMSFSYQGREITARKYHVLAYI